MTDGLLRLTLSVRSRFNLLSNDVYYTVIKCSVNFQNCPCIRRFSLRTLVILSIMLEPGTISHPKNDALYIFFSLSVGAEPKPISGKTTVTATFRHGTSKHRCLSGSPAQTHSIFTSALYRNTLHKSEFVRCIRRPMVRDLCKQWCRHITKFIGS